MDFGAGPGFGLAAHRRRGHLNIPSDSRLADQIQVGVEPALVHDGVGGVARGEEDAKVGSELLHPFGQLPAVEAARQADVGEDQVDTGRRRDRRQGLRAVNRHDDGVAQFLQHLGAEFADRFVILDQQDQFAAITGGNGFLASRLLGHRLAARGH